MAKTAHPLEAVLTNFAAAVAARLAAPVAGQPEDQLRGPIEVFFREVGRFLDCELLLVGETQLPGRLGRPDYAALIAGILTGYLELKEPGKGVRPDRYRGHDRRQAKRFESLPNIIYCDGNDLALYRDGKLVRDVVRIFRDIRQDDKRARDYSAADLVATLRDFVSWQPVVPTHAEGLADLIAPLCRIMRDDVADALRDPNSPLVRLAGDWRQLLFPEATNERFADAYAQTVTFALLLARSEGTDTSDIRAAVGRLAASHSLLSRALEVLTDQQIASEIPASLALMQRVIAAVSPRVLSQTARHDPWLYFYEHFLAAYDPDLRRNAGAYYTPIPVVRAQVRLVDSLVRDRLGRAHGLADADVVTLDPGVGTGTYLLGVIEHTLEHARANLGVGAVPGIATVLGRNLAGFEVMVGPYAVAELRLSRALLTNGGTMPPDGPAIYLTDTLESPFTQPPQIPLYLRPLAHQHERALRLKDGVTVLVCIGNPPYDRHPAVAGDDARARASGGGWVRWGSDGNPEHSIFNDFVAPVAAAGHAIDLKNLYNLYVYFWRWALWKVFEHTTAQGPGVVSFISAASYIDGDAFIGMRQHMRRVCDEIWVIDLGGEGRGTRRSDNVFDIKTPVAIAIAARYGNVALDQPATVRYTSIKGTRDEKLAALENVNNFSTWSWTECSSEWAAPFRPSGEGAYFDWPLLTDIFPWQHSGVQMKRTWPIAPDQDTLRRRWDALTAAGDSKAALFCETRDRRIDRTYPPLPGQSREPPLSSLDRNRAVPSLVRYGYRSFDRAWVIADARVGDFMRPSLWRISAVPQVFLATLLNHPLGEGPACTISVYPPDLHYFRGSYGAKEIIPLYRDPDRREFNITPGLLESVSRVLGQEVTGEQFFAYCYAVLAQSAFTERFSAELATRQLRVPVTTDAEVFNEVVDVGNRLVWLHSFGERSFNNTDRPAGQVPRGVARCTAPVNQSQAEYPEGAAYDVGNRSLFVGSGRFEPVDSTVFDFSVSGYRVVQAWIDYRSRFGAGRRSSDLDLIRPSSWSAQFTQELLELLWVIEHTLALRATQELLLEYIVGGQLISASSLPQPPAEFRVEPQERTSMFD